ncbi:MAG TPA: hypothetical protein VJ508_07875, partial [Saprospiraceae bacterium]|nr:hypothetical protein [Saprospiraceae bacterium]
SLTLALDVNTSKFSSYRITDADSAFQIGGITAGMDGRVITLINETDFPMELISEDTMALDSNRIVTGDHGNLVLDPMGTATMQYDTAAMKWIVNGSNQVPAGAAVWDTSGTSIFYDDNVGIGTSDPVSPLTIQTDTNAVGFTQIGGADSITLVTKINGNSASIGTSSNHILSLESGGEGKMHILPNGEVVIGKDSIVSNLLGPGHSRTNDFDSKLNIFTLPGESGWTHYGGDNQIIVNEGIGSSSASIGTMTENTFRIMTNNIGRLHVWYDGRVHIGSNEDVPNSQFTVFTPPNSFGISHTTSGGIILESHIGTSSASFGTYTNNEFRLTSNGATVLTCAPSGNVGIGTTNPPRKLTLFTDPNTFGFSQISSGGIEIASHIGGVSASFGTRTNNKFRLVANDQPIMTIHPNGNVGIGLGVNDEPANKLEVNGTIRSKEIIVETINWPDYVFNTDYKLSPLSSLDQYVREHHHLPNL